MNILITGGAGFIGSRLANTLHEQDHNICVVDNLSTGDKSNLIPEIRFEQRDIRNSTAMRMLFMDFAPDVVFHLAALARVQRSWDFPEETYDVNVNGTNSVLTVCREFETPKVFITSSSSVFGGISLESEPHPITVDEKQKPLNPYAYHKWLNEKTVEYYRSCWPDMNIIVGRPFNVYGEGQNYHSEYSTVIPKFFEYSHSHQILPVYGDGSQMRDFTYVGDIVRQMIAVTLGETSNQNFNLCSGTPTTLLDVAKAFGDSYECIENPRKGEAQWTWGDNNTGVEPSITIEDWVRSKL